MKLNHHAADFDVAACMVSHCNSPYCMRYALPCLLQLGVASHNVGVANPTMPRIIETFTPAIVSDIPTTITCMASYTHVL